LPGPGVNSLLVASSMKDFRSDMPIFPFLLYLLMPYLLGR
jgi:hypothetical protein